MLTTRKNFLAFFLFFNSDQTRYKFPFLNEKNKKKLKVGSTQNLKFFHKWSRIFLTHWFWFDVNPIPRCPNISKKLKLKLAILIGPQFYDVNGWQVV